MTGEGDHVCDPHVRPSMGFEVSLSDRARTILSFSAQLDHSRAGRAGSGCGGYPPGDMAVGSIVWLVVITRLRPGSLSTAATGSTGRRSSRRRRRSPARSTAGCTQSRVPVFRARDPPVQRLQVGRAQREEHHYLPAQERLLRRSARCRSPPSQDREPGGSEDSYQAHAEDPPRGDTARSDRV